jgi:recombinational DNA repair ATPase RecF
LAFKLAKLELTNSIFWEYAMILFDNVMSELGGERRPSFLDILDRNLGLFITTTELDVIFGIEGREQI